MWWVEEDVVGVAGAKRHPLTIVLASILASEPHLIHGLFEPRPPTLLSTSNITHILLIILKLCRRLFHLKTLSPFLFSLSSSPFPCSLKPPAAGRSPHSISSSHRVPPLTALSSRTFSNRPLPHCKREAKTKRHRPTNSPLRTTLLSVHIFRIRRQCSDKERTRERAPSSCLAIVFPSSKQRPCGASPLLFVCANSRVAAH